MPMPNWRDWQANDQGFYDGQQNGLQPDFNLRGVFRNNENGEYWFKGVKPKFFGRHPFRPAHLHYIVSADGYETLTTHIFDPDDPYIHSNAVFGVKQSFLARFDLIHDSARQAAAGYDKPYYEVAHDFIFAPTCLTSK